MDKKVDENYPATLSDNFLQGILRNQIGFKGVIISDDMQMAAIIDNYGVEESVIRAVNAGNDIIYFFNNSKAGYDGQIAYKVRDIIFNAVKNGKIREERITESYDRIIALKKQFRIISPSADQIKSEKFEMIGLPDAINFREAFDIAEYTGELTGIRPSFLLAVLQEELSLVNEFNLCYLKNFSTGEGITTDGKAIARVMNPTRDIPGFLKIAKDLHKDPSEILVTCPMSFGWGGAMGPADFIPSTWMKYKDKIKEITGQAADPWNIRDAFLAAGLYLSDSGAALKTQKGEYQAAMIYFSGATSSPYTWYADGTLAISNKIEADIEIIKNH
jgi:hypothetical protein